MTKNLWRKLNIWIYILAVMKCQGNAENWMQKKIANEANKHKMKKNYDVINVEKLLGQWAEFSIDYALRKATCYDSFDVPL